MSTTVIWTDWGDDDSIQLQRMWAGLDHIQVVHATRWNGVMERTVDLAIADEKDTLLFCGHGSSYGLMAPKSLTEYAIHQMNTRPFRQRMSSAYHVMHRLLQKELAFMDCSAECSYLI